MSSGGIRGATVPLILRSSGQGALEGQVCAAVAVMEAIRVRELTARMRDHPVQATRPRPLTDALAPVGGVVDGDGTTILATSAGTDCCAARSVSGPADQRTRPWWCWTRRGSTSRQRGLAVDVLGLVIAVTILAANTHDNTVGCRSASRRALVGVDKARDCRLEPDPPVDNDHGLTVQDYAGQQLHLRKRDAHPVHGHIPTERA